MKKLCLILFAVIFAGMLFAEADDVLASTSSVWSAETNGLRAGFYCPKQTIVLQLPNKVISDASFALFNATTNRVRYFSPKAIEERLDMRLTSTNGLPVPKTARGKKFEKSLSQPDNKPAKNLPSRSGWDSPEWLGRQYRSRPFIPAGAEFIHKLADEQGIGNLVLDCFRIEKPGEYNLTVVQRLYVVDQTNWMILKPTEFSPVTVRVKVEPR